ncbi:hypothetical protein E3E22_06010 [Thermococcus sp. MV5]|uniref:thiamine pyrophosphate-dependent enzyme n=1 Tax=Thermococcus sp. MV5 TaxID=1638272 RepID=UPI00143A1BBC|nr:thiamine pyrophosphate-dependent enzyme [Thermococcus sp. MV5]NJE26179.1 hypothetical protein [Thermococcus sp. MV5]
MGKLDLLSGNKAIAYGAKLSRVQVVSAYPITPQTPIVEYIAEFIANGELDAEYIYPEGEHSAVAAALAATIAGARGFTATSSQGLGYGFEIIAQAPAYRAPLVMAIANRTLGWYWSVASDYSDTMTTRDLGWIQFYAESCQECLDGVIQMYKIAEDERVLLPGMVCLDGFHLSHSSEPVNIPDQQEVDDYLPPRKIYNHTTDPTESEGYIFPSLPVRLHTTYRKMFEDVMQRARDVIYEATKEFSETFGRDTYGPVEEYYTDGAELLLVTMGSMSTAAKRAVDKLRNEGIKVGLLRVRFFRPFPSKELLELVKKNGVKAIGVADRAISHGTSMDPLGIEVAATLYKMKDRPNLINFIAGMGGDDVSIDDFENMIRKLIETLDRENVKETMYIEHPIKISKPSVTFKDVTYCPGSQLCSGCGAALAMRHILRILGKNSVLVFPPNCVSASLSMHFPSSWIGVPYVLANYAAAAAYARGLQRAYKYRNKKVHVTVIAGDGCTADIGLQSLSSAAESNEAIIWINYDNEAYMNTGIQRSGTTPLKAWTTTTPSGVKWHGKKETPKDMISIMIAHRVPYIATASPAFIHDFESKMKKAMEVVEKGEGLAYIHIQTPCPTGWRFPENKTIEVAKLGVLTGMWPLLEVDHGFFKLTLKLSKLRPVANYIKLQGRFRHLNDEDIAEIQEFANKRWRTFLELDGKALW